MLQSITTDVPGMTTDAEVTGLVNTPEKDTMISMTVTTVTITVLPHMLEVKFFYLLVDDTCSVFFGGEGVW